MKIFILSTYMFNNHNILFKYHTSRNILLSCASLMRNDTHLKIIHDTLPYEVPLYQSYIIHDWFKLNAEMGIQKLYNKMYAFITFSFCKKKGIISAILKSSHCIKSFMK